MNDDDDLIERFIIWTDGQRRKNRSTLADYRRELKALARWTRVEGIDSMVALKKDHLERFLFVARYERPTSQPIRNAAIRGLFKYLHDTGRLETNLTTGLKMDRPPRKAVRVRPGQLSQKTSKLESQDAAIARLFVAFPPDVGLEELFSIREEPPVGEAVTVRNREGVKRAVHIGERARKLLDAMDGHLPIGVRAFQRHLKAVGLTPRQLRLSPRSAVEVEMSPRLDVPLHTKMAHQEYEDAAKDAFVEIEEQLREITGTRLSGKRLVDEALGRGGALADAFDRESDREDVRALVAGAFGYFRNELGHRPVFFEDPMYAKEVVLLADLILRILEEATADLRVKRIQAGLSTAQAVQVSESELRKLPPFEFQKWVIRRFDGTHAPTWSGDMGIDGYSFPHERPIQAKQSDRVGRKVVDEFETAVERRGKDRAYLVAFGFTQTAYREAERARNSGKVDVRLVTVADLIRAVPS